MDNNIVDKKQKYIELADFKDMANIYYKELTKLSPQKGIGSHEHIYFTYGIEWAFNHLQQHTQKEIDGLFEIGGNVITYSYVLQMLSNHNFLLEALKKVQSLVSFSINAIPTGSTRNLLTDANILALEAIEKTEE